MQMEQLKTVPQRSKNRSQDGVVKHKPKIGLVHPDHEVIREQQHWLVGIIHISQPTQRKQRRKMLRLTFTDPIYLFSLTFQGIAQ